LPPDLLPARASQPSALDAYLARACPNAPKIPKGAKIPKSANGPEGSQTSSAFTQISDMLAEYVLPPALEAEMYQALAMLPGIQVDSHATAIDGQAGVAFVQSGTQTNLKNEIILNPSTYAFLAQGDWQPGGHLYENAVEQMTLVGAPGSTQPSVAPPTPAQVLAEKAEEAAWADSPGIVSSTGGAVTPGHIVRAGSLPPNR
jgi:hypothetical protein